MPDTTRAGAGAARGLEPLPRGDAALGERGKQNGGRQAPPLRLLTAEDLAERSRHRRARAITLLSVGLLLSALLAVGAAQAVVASQQVRLDGARQLLAASVQQNQALQLAHAQLSSPQRVLQIAERQLGMIVPSKVTYLSAVDTGRSSRATGAGSRTTGTTRRHHPASARL